MYNLTMATKTKPTSAIEKMRWVNRKYEATRLLLDLISIDLWFHVAHVILQMRSIPLWKDSLESRMRCEVICLR
jgi:hypothetical protein